MAIPSILIGLGALGFSIAVFLIAQDLREQEEQRDRVVLSIIVEKMENFLHRVDQIQNTPSPREVEIPLLKSSHITLNENLMYYGSSLKADHIKEVDEVMSRLSMVDTLFSDTDLYSHFKNKTKTENQLQPMRDFVEKYKTEN